MAYQLDCPQDAFMVQSDNLNEVREMVQTHVSNENHDMTPDEIDNAIQEQ